MKNDLIEQILDILFPVGDHSVMALRLKAMLDLGNKQVVIAEQDEVVLRLSKEEASCILLGCPYGENCVKGRKLPKGEDCPDECNAYRQLKEQLGEKK